MMEVKEAKVMKVRAQRERRELKGERIVTVRRQRDLIAQARVEAKQKRERAMKLKLKKNRVHYDEKVDVERHKRMETMANVS